MANFRKLLINKCQVEFEKHSQDESVVLGIIKCNDPEKKKGLHFELEEYYRKLRNTRFLGKTAKVIILYSEIFS